MNILFSKTIALLLSFSFLLSPISAFGYSLELDYLLDNEKTYETYDKYSDTYDLVENDIDIFELITILDLYGISLDEYLNVIDNENSISGIITMATIRASLTAIGRLGAVIPMSAHALQRVNERVFTSNIVARLMAHGTRYMDSGGARILYDASSRTALVLDRAGMTVVTTLDSVNLQQKITGPARWVLNRW